MRCALNFGQNGTYCFQFIICSSVSQLFEQVQSVTKNGRYRTYSPSVCLTSESFRNLSYVVFVQSDKLLSWGQFLVRTGPLEVKDIGIVCDTLPTYFSCLCDQATYYLYHPQNPLSTIFGLTSVHQFSISGGKTFCNIKGPKYSLSIRK